MSLIFEALKKGPAPAASKEPAAAVHVTPVPPQAAPESVPVVPLSVPAYRAEAAPSSFPGTGQLIALLVGMLLAGGGAWLYMAGKASNVNPVVIPAVMPPPQLTTAPAVAPAAAPTAPAPAAPAPAPIAKAKQPPLPVVPPVAPVVVASVPVSAPAPAPTPVPAVRPPVAKAVVPAVKAPVVSPAPAVAAALAPASAAPPAAPVSAVPAPLAEVKAVARAPINTQVQVAIEPNAFDMREAFQNFLQLLQSGQLPEAQLAADKISTAMGRSHVVSLRAQGYMALKKGDLAVARSQYLQLHQVLPEDREAGLNLALIEWRLGDREAAAKRVARLLEKFPNDPEIQALYMNVRSP